MSHNVTAAQLTILTGSEENLIPDVRGNWTPREMVERKLIALSYTRRPGAFTTFHEERQRHRP